ncbi:hypothetical protein CQW23_03201 [Capsicum baccatum]|uniref:Ribosomal RNA methyltransferase SPB1-like C-terminal domain-containing protein n=1 Tax=Capsicum baccatum TaxID=33114 RepID=A0A2G2XB56_CAPBA|nr:hypothetical protein CQW23_03201 [Capsicum baccatum]
MEELKATELAKKKRAKRLLAKRQAKGKRGVVALQDNEYNDETSSEDDENDLESSENSSSGGESEEECDNEIERFLDDLEDRKKRYIARVERKTKRPKISYLDDGELLEDGDEDGMTHYAQDSDSDKGEDQVNPLIIPLETTPSQGDVVKAWFTRDVFVEPEEQDTSEDFEIVPAPSSVSSDSSSDESDESGDAINGRAEILCAGKKMTLKRQRKLMMDDGYNKYVFHDEGLPKWFINNEKRHRQPIKPVTKEEVAAVKA